MRTIYRFHAVAFALALLLTACGGEPAEEAPEAQPAAEAPAAGDAAAAGDAMGSDATATDAFTSPDQASREELLAIPGMSEAAVDALIAGRPYADMLEVDAVLAGHMDEVEREALYATLWKPLDLNEASGEEILLIPGVGERMEHEFEEYRPYRAMAEFHREIGKYVDEDEVQRLARYVEIR